MGELFLFSLTDLSKVLNGELVFLICFIAVFLLTILCVVFSLSKKDYFLRQRLWIIFSFVSISLIDFWVEKYIIGQIKFLILLIALEILSLSICLFIRKQEKGFSNEKKILANFLSKCATQQNYDSYNQNVGTEIRSEVIKAQPETQGNLKEEIDFSHVKGVLKKLEYYPLKEQDKKSAKELENAILDAEQNGLDQRLKQTINDGLGALLKLMSKYAI